MKNTFAERKDLKIFFTNLENSIGTLDLEKATEQKGGHDWKDEALVILTGTGRIDGLTVKEGSIEYDLSDVVELTSSWNLYRDGSCNSCNNYSSHGCSIYHDPGNICPDYDAHIKDPEGKTARSLEELIEDVSSA